MTDVRALAFQTLGDTWGVDVPEERLKAFAKAVRNAALAEAARECTRAALIGDGGAARVEQGAREMCQLAILALRE